MDRVHAMFAGDEDGYRQGKRCRRRNGHPVWTRVAVATIPDQAGGPYPALAMMEDVTTQRAVREAIPSALGSCASPTTRTCSKAWATTPTPP